MSDPGVAPDEQIASLIRQISEEKSTPKPDKKKLRKWCKDIERIKGGFPPQASSADCSKPRGETNTSLGECSFADGEVAVVVDPPSAADHDRALGLQAEPLTEEEQEHEAQLDAGRLLRGVLIFFLAAKRPAQIGKRVLVFCHHLAPDLMATTTASDLAKELGYTKAEISRLGTVMHDTLKVRSVRFRSEKARANMREAALAKDSEDEEEVSPIDAAAEDEFINPLATDNQDTNESNA